MSRVHANTSRRPSALRFTDGAVASMPYTNLPSGLRNSGCGTPSPSQSDHPLLGAVCQICIREPFQPADEHFKAAIISPDHLHSWITQSNVCPNRSAKRDLRLPQIISSTIMKGIAAEIVAREWADQNVPSRLIGICCKRVRLI